MTDGTATAPSLFRNIAFVDFSAGPALCKRLAKAIERYLFLSNFTAAVFVFLYLSLVVPTKPSDNGVSDVLLFGVFLAISFPTCGFLCQRAAKRATDWLAEARPPTDAERYDTLKLAFRTSCYSLGAWLFAAVLFGAGSAIGGDPATDVATVGLTIFDGGLVACAVGFLLLERAMRPVYALALSGEPPEHPNTLGIRLRLILAWALGSAVPLAGLWLLPLAAKHADGQDRHRPGRARALVGGHGRSASS